MGDDGKCLCLRARAATFPSWQELVQLLDDVHSIHRATSSCAGQVLNPVPLPLAHKNRKDLLSEERVSDFTEKSKKKRCVNKKKQPFFRCL